MGSTEVTTEERLNIETNYANIKSYIMSFPEEMLNIETNYANIVP